MVLHSASTVISTAPRKGGAAGGGAELEFMPLGPDSVQKLPGPVQLDGTEGGLVQGSGGIGVLLLFSLSVVSDSATPWTAAHQAFLSFTLSWSLLKLMSIESMMPSNHLILCCLLLLLPSIFPSIRVLPSELALRIRCESIGELVYNKQRGVKILQMKISLVVL